MKKFFRSKLFICFILLILAGVLTFGFLPRMYGSQTATVEVVQLIKDVEMGTRISESMLVTKTIGSYGVDNSVIKNKADIVGKYATSEIRRDSNLYSDMFSAEWTDIEGAVDTMLKPEDRIINVSMKNISASVGGQLKPGDIVDVYTEVIAAPVPNEYGYTEDGKKIKMELAPLMQNVRVYKILNNALEDITELNRKYTSLVERNDGSEQNFDSSMIPATISLIVSNEQALKLATQEYSGTIHLVKHPVSANEAANTPAPEKPAA